MLGTACGDIIGSIYEWDNIKTKDFPLFKRAMNFFTDDTIMTFATAEALVHGADFGKTYHRFGRMYNKRRYGYGSNFLHWIRSDDPQPYDSYGNGSAMRAGPIGWAFDTIEETLLAAEASAMPTHNHPEGVKGAKAVAAAVFFARNGETTESIRERVAEITGYDFSCTPDRIRSEYTFDVSCQGSVPQALAAFFESTSFEDAIRNAISIGGDSDTVAAITGSIAEAYYGMPASIEADTVAHIPEHFEGIVREFEEAFPAYGKRKRG